MTVNTIQLVTIDPNLYTAYLLIGGSAGGTRRSNGSIAFTKELRTVQRAGLEHFKLSKATARDYALLNAAIVARGGWPLRLTSAYRPGTHQQEARRAYDAWKMAGKPEPGGAGWVRGMKNAYVALDSNHEWGGAVDIDVEALCFKLPDGRTIKGTDEDGGGDECLLILWEEAHKLGFKEIIRDCDIDQSESWHFNHLGPLQVLDAMFRGAGTRYRSLASREVAIAGKVLAGCWMGDRPNERYVQARLNIGGFWCGRHDGRPGKMTKDALARALPEKSAAQLAQAKPMTWTAWLNEAEVGLEAIAEL